MKTLFAFISMAAGVLAVAGCSKMDGVESTPGISSIWKVSMQGSSGTGTKVLTEEGTSLKHTWGENDKVYVMKMDDGTICGTLIPEKTGTSKTYLKGEIEGDFTKDDKFLLISTARSNFSGALIFGGSGTLEDLSQYIYGTAEGLIETLNEDGKILQFADATFKPCQSVTKFTLDRPVSRLYVSAPGIAYVIDSPSMTVYNSVLQCYDPSFASRNTFYCAIYGDISGTFTIIAEDESDKLFTATKTASLEAGKFYTADLQLTSLSEAVASQPEWVDIGSTVQWRTRNLGADKPIESGNHYAWGEIETKTDYSWGTYRYGDDPFRLTKYCYNASYGKDGYVEDPIRYTLEAEDDAATQVLGDSYRIPTIDEWIDMSSHCCSAIVSYDPEMPGIIYLSYKKENAFVYLPVTGEYDGESFSNPYSGSGYYWTSTSVRKGSENGSYPYEAFSIRFIRNSIYVGLRFGRQLGKAIRPVKVD